MTSNPVPDAANVYYPSRTIVPLANDLVVNLIGTPLNERAPFAVIEVPDAGMPSVHRFSVFEELVGFLRSRVGQPVAVYPVFGAVLNITAGAHKYLQTPWGPFSLMDHAEPAPAVNNYLGPPVVVPAVPTAAEAMQADARREQDLEEQDALYSVNDGDDDDVEDETEPARHPRFNDESGDDEG